MRPLIGITTELTTARYGAWEQEAALVPLDYVRGVERAGGRAVLVPPSDDGLEETLAVLDGIVFSGGPDLDPAEYGQERHAQTAGVTPERDRAELALLRAALARDLPVLAICRGGQLLNVARGGDLVQHLPDVLGTDLHKRTPGSFAEHGVRAEGRLAEILGSELEIKSHHHQGVGRVGEGLQPVAWAEDGTVEGLEDPGRRFAVGVLWHPEAGDDAALFEALVAEARAFRAAR
jgi:gamma-glutamyl-gamma-aminobutyrate hydrolase PuuD